MVLASNGRSISGAARVRRRADARRLAILRAAARVFRARGIAAAGMREIAEAADLSPANLYHYFRGKDQLLFFCQDRSLDRLLAALDEARRTRGPMPVRLRQLAEAHLRCLLDEVDGSSAHLDVDALPSRLRAAIVAKRDRYERGVRALVASGIRAGVLRRAEATVATRAFLGALNWTAYWYRPSGAVPSTRIASQVAEYAVAGLARADHPRLEGRPASEAVAARRADRQQRASRGRVRAVQDPPGGAS